MIVAVNFLVWCDFTIRIRINLPDLISTGYGTRYLIDKSDPDLIILQKIVGVTEIGHTVRHEHWCKSNGCGGGFKFIEICHNLDPVSSRLTRLHKK